MCHSIMTTRPTEQNPATPSILVVNAVATELDVDPATLEPPLASAIDPDALDTLLDAEGPNATVSFEYANCLVSVGADGEVSVESTGVHA